jgi:hypothetical protein
VGDVVISVKERVPALMKPSRKTGVHLVSRSSVFLAVTIQIASPLFLICYASGFCGSRSSQRTVNSVGLATNVQGHGHEERAVTVADAIRMTRFGDPSYQNGGSSKGIVGKFSGDGKHFAVVLRKGDLEQNTNEYSLLLFKTEEVFRSPTPKILLSFSSSSNRPAIKNVTWLEDNDTILFLGEHPGERTQLYSVKCSTGELRKLTNHRTNLTSFAATTGSAELVYTAESPVSDLESKQALRYGVHVSTEVLTDLVRGRFHEEHPDQDLFVSQLGVEGVRQIALDGTIESPDAEISLSPDENYFVVRTETRQIPESWSGYEDKFLQIMTRQKHPRGVRTFVSRYELVDIRSGKSQILLDTPIPSGGSEIVWSPDSRSVVLSDVYLPLNVDNPEEQAVRKSRTFLLEIRVPDRDFVKISDDDLRLINWDAKADSVVCEVGRIASLNGLPAVKVYFRKNGEKWHSAPPWDETIVRRPEIILEESANVTPRIVAFDANSGQRSLLLDLNPQFRDLTFGNVEQVKWEDTQGNEINGGLYWPPEYRPGLRYPLIIQTHGFKSNRFWIEGPWATAFAAQPLANRGFFVLQVPDPEARFWDTPDEAVRAMASYEGAIDYLDRRGLIDGSRVGIIGFSRTCLYVTYTLTHSHSTYRIAAAAISDGIDGGYFQYAAFSNSVPALANEFDLLNGAPPFGEGLSVWMKKSSSFLMDKVESPLRIEAIGPTSLISGWHWFSGLSRLGKPVDMTYILDGTHILERPWDRMISQQGNVDWFCFWLKGQEDPDPAKSEQYTRWRELKKMQQENEAKAKATAVN